MLTDKPTPDNEQPVSNNIDVTPMKEVSVETPFKEGLTQIETEKEPAVEGEIPTHIEQKLAEYNIPKEYIEKYSLELALLYCQPKVDVKALAKRYGSKIGKYHSFPELENSPINRACFANNVQCEGGIRIWKGENNVSRKGRR